MCRMGKKADTRARPECGLMGYQSPERNSNTKKMMLTIGPAASWFGIRVLTAMPMAVKESAPTSRATAQGGQVVREVHVVAESPDEQQDDNLQEGHDDRIDTNRRE